MGFKLISILGPTASGKSAVAMELARRLNGEIVSCDSMQVYRGLDIGTAKPTTDERREIPHHLVDHVDPDQPYSVRQFLADADAAINEIGCRGAQPILCGGTGLYARALLYGYELWPSDKRIAATIRREYQAGRAQQLLQELRQAAPDLADHLQANPRRWLRALEVVRLTGSPPNLQEEFESPHYVAPEFILMPDAALNRERIRQRTEAMLRAGWIEEARQLFRNGLAVAPTAVQALGYREIGRYIAGEIATREELIDRLTTLTARYAKRQRTWFRHQHPNGIQVPVSGNDTPLTLADRLQELL